MEFKITYVNPRRPSKTVGPERFEKSAAFAPVLRLAVGESISGRYRTAGYKTIKRVA